MNPNSRKWRRIVKTFHDVWHEAGRTTGYTYLSTKPRARLDNIFATKDLTIEDAEVVVSIPNASDHLPLISTFSM